MTYKQKIFFSSCLFFISCNNCEKLNLSNNEEEWVDGFHSESTSYFINKKGIKDTLIVKEIRNFHLECNSLETSQFQDEIFDIEFVFKTKNEYNKVKPLLSIDKNSKDTIFPHIYLGNLGPLKNQIENIKNHPRSINTILNGKRYRDLFFFEEGVNVEEYGDKSYFTNFFWNKHLGLIAYTTINKDFYIKQ